MKNYALGICIGFILLTPLTFAQTNPSGSPDDLQQLTTQLQRSPGDEELREKIIKLVLTFDLKPEPAAAVDEQVGAATYAFKNATAEADFVIAAELYAKASLLAPWVPDYYFNQGVALEKAKRNDPAIAAFNWYLKAAPNAQDARQVRERIGGLKFASKKASDAAAIDAAWKAAEQDVQRQQAKISEGLQGGVWRLEEDSTIKLSEHRLWRQGDGVGQDYIVMNGREMKAYGMIKPSKGGVLDAAAFARKVDYDDPTANRWDIWKAVVESRTFETNLNDDRGTQVKVMISEDGRSITTESTWHYPNDSTLFQSTGLYRRIK